MLSQKRKNTIKRVISSVIYEEMGKIEGPPEIMDNDEKERFDLLGELEYRIEINLDELFDSWGRNKRPSMAESQN